MPNSRILYWLEMVNGQGAQILLWAMGGLEVIIQK